MILLILPSLVTLHLQCLPLLLLRLACVFHLAESLLRSEHPTSDSGAPLLPLLGTPKRCAVGVFCSFARLVRRRVLLHYPCRRRQLEHFLWQPLLPTNLHVIT